jgi:hypothetical protein
VTNYITIGAATSPALSQGWTGEAAVARRTVPSVVTVKGTGLPISGFGARRAAGVLMGADRVRETVTVAVQADDQRIPPRCGPVRC